MSLRDALNRLEVEIDWDKVDMDSGKQTWHEQRGYLRRDSIAAILRLVAEAVERKSPVSWTELGKPMAELEASMANKPQWQQVIEVGAKGERTNIVSFLRRGGEG